MNQKDLEFRVSGLLGEFKASLSYTARFCLKKAKREVTHQVEYMLSNHEDLSSNPQNILNNQA